MSMYDLALGDGYEEMRRAYLLHGVLGGLPVARYRNAWVESDHDGPIIAVYTRQGGANRDDYCETPDEHVPQKCSAASNEALRAHPLYITDNDDEFDSTYATFYFRAPEGWRERLAAIAGPSVNMDERWRDAIARIQAGDVTPAQVAAGDQIVAALKDPDGPQVIEI